MSRIQNNINLNFLMQSNVKIIQELITLSTTLIKALLDGLICSLRKFTQSP
jgi:hypothetical protein